MARGQEIEELYISLGLNIDDLKLGFDTAGKTVAQAITRLNSDNKKIQLQTDIDLSKLQGMENELERIRAEHEAINRQLDIQKQKEAILQAQLQGNRKNYGAEHGLSQKAEMNLLYQQKNVAALEAKLRQLTASLKAMETQETKTGAEATNMFTRIKSGADSARAGVNSITSELTGGFNLLSAKMASVMAIASSGAGLFALTTAAMNAGHETYKLTQRLHMTAGEVGALKRVFDLTGTDLNAIVPFIARIDKQLTSAGEKGNAFSKSLDGFGIKLTDESGHLLQVNEQLDRLATGYKRAQEAGEEEAFTAEILGAKGAQLIPVLQDYNDLMAMSKNVATTGILNPAEAHKLWQEWKQMTMEMGQLKSAMGQALLPVSAELMPDILEGFRNAVVLVKENKDGIVELGRTIADVMGAAKDAISAVADLLDALGVNLKNISSLIHDVRTAVKSGNFSKLAGGTAAGLVAGGTLGAKAVAGLTVMTGGAAVPLAPFIVGSGAIAGSAVGFWGGLKASEWDKNFQAARKAEEEAKKNKKPSAKTDNKAAENMEKVKVATEAEKKAAEDAAKANEELKDSLYALGHSDLQNSLHKVEEQVRKYREKGADEVQLTRWAEEQKAKIVKDFNDQVAQSVDSIWKSEYQNRLDSIQREKDAWIQKGLDEVKATEWAEERKRQLQQETALHMFKEQYKYLKLYRQEMAQGYGTQEEKQARAQQAILNQMRKDSGITGDMWTTPGEIAAFSNMMKQVKEMLVPIYDKEPTNFMWKGNEAIPMRNIPEAQPPMPDERYNKAMDNMSNAQESRQTIDYNLNVQVSGLEDVSNEVADSAAKIILDQLPSGSKYNISYGG